MRQLLYGDLTSWYRLVDPPADHLEEALCFTAAFDRAVTPRARTLLELGAGAGHNALHLKARFACTLVDLSPQMSALSRELNPECEHIVADMRTLRLEQQFDVVLVHDAIVYMTSEADLFSAIRTAYDHTRPGGAVIIASDGYKDTFEENTETQHESDGSRSAVLTMWDWDPDPEDDTFNTEYVLLMRDGDRVEAAHETHVQGLFSLAVWRRLLAQAGFTVELIARPLGDGLSDEVFLCKKPQGASAAPE